MFTEINRKHLLKILLEIFTNNFYLYFLLQIGFFVCLFHVRDLEKGLEILQS